MTVRWKDKTDITTLAGGDRIPVTDVSASNVDKYTTPDEIATFVGSPIVLAVESGSVSAVATLDITLSTADMYEIDLINFRPATDVVEFYVRFSQSSTYLSGATDYQWGYQRNGFGLTDNSDSEIHLATNLGSGADEHITLTCRVYRPSASSQIKTMLHSTYSITSAGDTVAVQGGGHLQANSNAIDGIRFFFSSGNITSGYYAVRSYSFT